MNLKNLPSRYTQASDEMKGSDIPNTQSVESALDRATTGNVVRDVKHRLRPGFLTWRGNNPIFNIKEAKRISGKQHDIEASLQEKLVRTPDSSTPTQGKLKREFPNVEPLVVNTQDLSGVSESSGWMCKVIFFGCGLALGWVLARRA